MTARADRRGRSGRAGGRVARAAAGFSLLEVLVALALTAMIAGVAAGGLRLSGSASAAAAQAAEAAAERRALRRFLTELVESAAPPLLRDGSRSPPALFEGDAEGFVTVARLPAALAPATPQLVSLRAREGGLELRWGPLGAQRPDLALTAPAGLERLTAGPVAVRFAYGLDGAPRWSGRAAAPPLIVITLDWRDRSMRIVAAPRAQGDAS